MMSHHEDYQPNYEDDNENNSKKRKGEEDSSSNKKLRDNDSNSSRREDESNYNLPPPQYEQRGNNVFVSNLTLDVDEQKLSTMFAHCGPIASTKIMYDLTTRLSKGYGFVRFETPDGARRALQEMNGVKSGNRSLEVKMAENRNEGLIGTPTTNVFVKGLPVTVTEDQLEALFKHYGKILQHKLLKGNDHSSTVSRGQGFVRFENQQEADLAINSLNGYIFPGTQKGLVVRYADNDEEKYKRKIKVLKRQQMMGGGYPGTSGSYGSSSGNSGYGNPSSSYGYPQQSYNQYGQYSGYSGYSDPTQGGPTSSYSSSSTSDPYSPSANQNGEANLFVYHLPPNADDTLLYRLFSPYGAIVSVRIMRDGTTGECKGFGFVKMATYASALNAIQGLNGVKVENKFLNITFKRSKDTPMF